MRELRFRLDPLVDIQLDGHHMRNGRPVPTLLRADPADAIEAANEARRLVLAGMPLDALPVSLTHRLGAPSVE